jgi:hypothetical protein
MSLFPQVADLSDLIKSNHQEGHQVCLFFPPNRSGWTLKVIECILRCQVSSDLLKRMEKEVEIFHTERIDQICLNLLPAETEFEF